MAQAQAQAQEFGDDDGERSAVVTYQDIREGRQYAAMTRIHYTSPGRYRAEVGAFARSCLAHASKQSAPFEIEWSRPDPWNTAPMERAGVAVVGHHAAGIITHGRDHGDAAGESE